MKLIIGGAFQGKLEYAVKTEHLKKEDIFTCTDEHIDFTKPCINHLEEYTLACIQKGIDPAAAFRANETLWKDSVLICQDIFCGVVPLGAELRLWRNTTGKLCQYLSQNAAQVVRIFCGLEQKLK